MFTFKGSHKNYQVQALMKKVAILIPTKNRIDFLIRTIKYYVSINRLHPILKQFITKFYEGYESR